MPARTEEFEDRASLDQWVVDLQFFAHDLDAGMTTTVDVCGVTVNIVYRKFSDLSGMDISTDASAILDKYLGLELNQVHVHPSIRECVLSMI